MSMESFALKVTSNGVWSNKFTMVLMRHRFKALLPGEKNKSLDYHGPKPIDASYIRTYSHITPYIRFTSQI